MQSFSDGRILWKTDDSGGKSQRRMARVERCTSWWWWLKPISIVLSLLHSEMNCGRTVIIIYHLKSVAAIPCEIWTFNSKVVQFIVTQSRLFTVNKNIYRDVTFSIVWLCWLIYNNITACIQNAAPTTCVLAKAQTPLHGHRLRTCCTTPPTDELTTILQQICHIAMPEPNILTCQDVGMWQIFVRWWWLCCTTSCTVVVSSSVAGVRCWCS